MAAPVVGLRACSAVQSGAADCFAAAAQQAGGGAGGILPRLTEDTCLPLVQSEACRTWKYQ